MLVNFDLHFHVEWAPSSRSVYRLAILLGCLTVDAVVMMSQVMVSQEFRLTQHDEATLASRVLVPSLIRGQL